MKSISQSIANIILWLEPAILVVIGIAFFYPTPTRTDWLWLLLLLLPVYMARYVLHGRLLTRTPLDGLFAAFLVLGAINVYAAPYTRGLMMLARPLYGMAIYYAMVEAARTQGHMRGVLQTMIILSLVIGVVALGATQWPVHDKAKMLTPITETLFTIQNIPGVGAGFNSNEISGAMIYLIPLTGIIMIERWRQRDTRWDVTLAFLSLFTALTLAQSRFAIVGVLGSFVLAAGLLLASNRLRLIFAGVLAGLLILEAGLAFNLNTTTVITNPRPEQTRDQTSFQVRRAVWQSGLDIVRDHPLTGVGLAMFRDGRVRERYPIKGFENQILPHAHNEVLQTATDMGIPGLLVFLGIHVGGVWMLIQIWRRGVSTARVVGVAAGCGLLAHFVFGMADAITLWDRFAFLFWALLGVLAAQYKLVVHLPPVASSKQLKSISASGENSPAQS